MSNPTWTDLIDDFDRADGLINAGAGALIWADHAIAVVTPPGVVIQGNSIGPVSGWASALLSDIIASDFDMIMDCVVSPVGDDSISFWMCGTKMDQNDFCSFVVAWDGSTWNAIEYTDGAGMMINGTPGPSVDSPPVAGKSFWVSKRGLTVELYSCSTGMTAFSLVASFLVPPERSTPGMFGFQFPGNALIQRWDNLVGGPILKPDYDDLLDDFNRVNGPVYAGAGALIWTDHEAGSTNLTPYVINNNQLKSSSGGWILCTSLIELESDFDLSVDVVNPGSGFGILFGGIDLDTPNWGGGTYGFSGGTWYGTQHVDGTGYAVANIDDSAPVAGSKYWISKRGTNVSLYKALPGETFILVGSAIFDQIGEGAFGFQAPDAVVVLDNLRGGPIKTEAQVIIVPTRLIRIKTSAGWMNIN